ncbi:MULTISPECIES: DUF3131 domain-containing protein [Ramlibacter]|uniref:DUF3131 domain-containing protein n=1 Tax=Ramlibacter pinisoli TaxID=2682844 RepID=A0A6N8IRM7_9BURK|nr:MULTISPECIES: DUF3131 domain-containing protein [Ramlibacter]MBA2964416.1 DUF3131 domain-containing protein [Ramlibacter sp. CGMCC 1.13660]MVQ29382.1 DUF3131 domain-containing protein [Ramlibacter pinisoli]
MEQERQEFATGDDNNWVKARSSLVWIAAILVAFGSVWWIERESGKELIARRPGAPVQAAPAPAVLPASPDLPAALPAPRALTEQEKQWARTAWTYFERNTDPATGLASSVEGFPSTSLWDTASSLLALLAARDLGLVDQKAFDARMARALDALGRLPLYANALPNKTYDTRTLAMTDYRNQPAPAGIGWSAIDIGRLLVPLNAIAWQHPQHTEAARRAIARWNTAQLARDGQLWGLQAGEGGGPPQPVQEGRLGYEQYAARTLALMGLDVDVAADPMAHLQLVDIEGIAVPADRREPATHGAQNHVVSEPWILQGLEFGWTRQSREIAWRVYRAQEERFRKTGVKTAATEDHVDQPPYFVYNSLYNGGRRWVAVSEKGEEMPQLRTLSTKAAFGWHALLRTPYTTQLVDAVAGLNDPARGWYAGRYEAGDKPNQSVNANTNAVVLESLAYIVRGRLLQYR